jgi:hypothetical protein
MESASAKIVLGIFFFEILFYSFILAFFGTFVATVCLSIDIGLLGLLLLYIDNFYKAGE